MRLFAALRVPSPAREDLSAFLEPRLSAFDVSWTPPEHWHLTLAFAADAPEHAVPALAERLATVAARRCRFDVTLAGGGTFPDPFAARVLYAVPQTDAAGGLELDRLSASARAAASTSGIAVDGARFVPHLTLARSRRAMVASRWLQVLETYRGPTWRPESVELVASHLGESRLNPRRHEVIGTFPLAADED